MGSHNQANAFAPNWGQTIFQSANEMAQNALFRKQIEEQQSSAKEEREWWNRKKASIQEDFMKELEEGADSSKMGKKAAGAQGATNPSPAEKLGSDDDTVLVEGGGPAVGGGGVGGSTKKKKKGKK
jgi:translocation protein SEC66